MNKLVAPIMGLVGLASAVVSGGYYQQANALAVCSDKGVPIRLTVEKVRNSKGTIKAELYGSKSKKTLAKSQKLDRKRVKARQGETHLCLNAPLQGKYSVVIYHDENDNKKFDRNFIGIPKEGFGFSNNPTIRLGLPEQDEILFKVEDTRTDLSISVIYL